MKVARHRHPTTLALSDGDTMVETCVATGGLLRPYHLRLRIYPTFRTSSQPTILRLRFTLYIFIPAATWVFCACFSFSSQVSYGSVPRPPIMFTGLCTVGLSLGHSNPLTQYCVEPSWQPFIVHPMSKVRHRLDDPDSGLRVALRHSNDYAMSI